MALIDKETIREEIDKRYAEYRAKMKTDDFTYYEGMADALDHLEQFLDTIPEQTVEGLEKEIERYWNWVTGFQPSFAVLELTREDFAKVARHFAEWQRERDDLETADLLAVAHLQGMEQQKAKMIEEWLKDRDGCFWDGVEEGKKAMEKQMMEKAVEGVAEELYNDGDVHCTVGVGTHFKPGDKVIIIPKED